MRGMILAACAAILAGTAGARAADSLGIREEQVLQTKGTVVDLLCQVAHDCPPACGGGKRQLGILTADGKLLVAGKAAAIFFGATKDLLPYCGKEIETDGITTSGFGSTLYMVQRVRTSADAPWVATNQSMIDWAKAYNETFPSEELNTWFRRDKTVAAAVAKRGKLGVPE